MTGCHGRPKQKREFRSRSHRDEPLVSERPRTWRVGAVQSRIRETRWWTCPYREEKFGSVIEETADYTDILETYVGILYFCTRRSPKNIPRVKRRLDLRIYPDTTGGKSGGPR